MKKTLLLFAALAGAASAASISYDDMGDSLRQSLLASYSLTEAGTADYSSQEFGLKIWKNGAGAVDGGFTVENGHAVVGSGRVNPYNTAFAADTFTGTSFTVSFDLLTLNTGNDYGVLFAIYSNGASGGWDHALTLRGGENAEAPLLLSSHEGGSSATGFDGKTTASKIDTGIAGNSGTVGKTLTIVSDGGAGTLSLYIDGVQQGEAITGWDSAKPTGIQFGGLLGGQHELQGATLNNVNIWDRALSASEVFSLVVPEPSSTVLSLLALAGLASRRRRK